VIIKYLNIQKFDD